ncbi:hypothetical protein Manayef4_01555 [Frankia sp. CgMI4]|uniref:hypothetical protein n=1 Tax=Frankia sp. CgMI4 TaxID=1742262 RepID=UPI000872C0E3|nr:hypothetical protein [Frankia sp. CgIM4]OFB44091.1 hypothetical protein Manayef4_01555 [Frankia sp. CgIM4]
MDRQDTQPGQPEPGTGDVGGDPSGSDHDSSPGSHGGSGSGRVGPQLAARMLAVVAVAAALAVLVFALADPSPSRHMRGLLITVNLVCLAGVFTAWLRVALVVGAARAPGGIE